MVVVEVAVTRGGLLPLRTIAEMQALGHQVGVVFLERSGPARIDDSASGQSEDTGWEAGAIVRLVAAGVRTIRGANLRTARQSLAVLEALAEARGPS